jgi:hypothetical protein
VGDNQHRLAHLVGHTGQQVEDELRVGGVQVAGRFVGQDDAGGVRQRARDGHALLFASGKVAGGAV